MLPNYLKLSIRLLLRSPFLSAIIIFGLSLGFAAFFVLWQYASDQLTCDEYHREYTSKGRLVLRWRHHDDLGNVTESLESGSGPGFAQALQDEHAELLAYTRLYYQTHFNIHIVAHGKEIFLRRLGDEQEQTAFKEENLAYADPNFFQFFTIPLIKGASETVLKDPHSIVLSESMATKYFGKENPVNSHIVLNDSITLTVSGIFEDLPHNTHLTFDAIISTELIGNAFNDLSEGDHSCMTYWHIRSGTNWNELSRKVDTSIERFLAPAYASLNINPDDTEFFLQPLNEIAYSGFSGDVHKARSRMLLSTLLIVSVVIIVAAWINYINLLNYANRKRMKELGVRRTSGAKNSDIISQFILESIVINGLSILVAVTIIQVAKTPLKDFFDIHFTSNVTRVTVLIIAIISIAGIIVTGIYPALNMLKRTPKGILPDGHFTNFQLGKWLTVFQFTITIVLMTSVFIIYRQLRYVLNKDLGIKKDEVVVVDLPENSKSYPRTKLNSFLGELASISGVTDFALSSSVPGDDTRNGVGLQRSSSSTFIGTDTNGGVDERFIPFYKLKLLAGRNFLPGDSVNKHSMIVSRKVLHRLGIQHPEEAVGTTILVESTAWTHDMQPTEIIGVIEDYQRRPMYLEATGWSNEGGVVLTYFDNVDAENTPQKVSLLIKQHVFQETASQVKKLYEKTFSHSYFNWYFLEKNVTRHYEVEKTTKNQLLLFVVLAIGIACLGFLGTIANKSKEKTKEIGIRKILGARVAQIASLLLGTTVPEIIISSIIAVPSTHFLTQAYMQKFSEQVAIQWWHYATPLVVLLAILLLTVASTVKKAANTNPVDSLRHE